MIAALEISRSGFVLRTFSSPTVAYLGRISYGTYLWHWPVIVIASRRFHPSAIAMFALTCLVSTGIASLSFQVLEHPVRATPRLDRPKVFVIATGLAISILSGIVLIPAILRQGHRSGASVAQAAVGGGANGWRIATPQGLDVVGAKNGSYGNKSCFHAPIDSCSVVRGTSGRILLMGDSHALTLIPAFSALARQHSMTLATAIHVNCPWMRGIVANPFGVAAGFASACHDVQDDWYERILPAFHPDVVVVVHRSDDDPINREDIRRADGQVVKYGSRDFEPTLAEATRRSVDLLRAQGRRVIIIEPMPLAPGTYDPLGCLSSAKFLEDCRYVATERPTPEEQLDRSLADQRTVWSFNIDRLICPYFPICDPVVDGKIVKKDPQHITADFARSLAAPINDLLMRNAVIR